MTVCVRLNKTRMIGMLELLSYESEFFIVSHTLCRTGSQNALAILPGTSHCQVVLQICIQQAEVMLLGAWFLVTYIKHPLMTN